MKPNALERENRPRGAAISACRAARQANLKELGYGA